MRCNSNPTPCQFDSANPRKHSTAFDFVLPIMEELAARSKIGEFTIAPERLSKLSGGFRTGSISPDIAASLLAFLVWIGTLEVVKGVTQTYQFTHDYTVTTSQ